MAANSVAFVRAALGAPSASKEQGSVEASHVGSTCKAIAAKTAGAARWLGATPELAAGVDEWLGWAGSEFTPLVDEKLFKASVGPTDLTMPGNASDQGLDQRLDRPRLFIPSLQPPAPQATSTIHATLAGTTHLI